MPYSITTTLPYVNADPHIGFALEIVQADALARLARLRGEEVIFNTGTDEHGLKIYQQALAAGLDPKTYCDGFAEKFDDLKELLDLSYTNFIRTTDTHHIAAAQEFWKRCAANGDIYKKQYAIKYCVGCELEKTDSELQDGRCPLHPNKEIELIDEENYFFRWSNYEKQLLALYEERPDFVVPKTRLNEIRSFIAGGLQDFSISRLAKKMPWGIPVPGDETQVMYVWFDALVNYISTLGWPEADILVDGTWPAIQVAGKDNLRQQSAMWQAMLLSAGLPPSKQIFIHGFITAEGQKMSKSLGNVISPTDIVREYGTDALRYYLLGALPAWSDGDYSATQFAEMYNSKLANGVGNLVARANSMIEKYCDGCIAPAQEDIFATTAVWEKYHAAAAQYRFDEMVQAVDQLVIHCNQYIDQTAPWKIAKEKGDVAAALAPVMEAVRHIGLMLLPIIPQTAEKILQSQSIALDELHLHTAAVWGSAPTRPLAAAGILFPRLS